MNTTASETLTDLDIILIFARDAVWTAENAEVCARLALNAAMETGDMKMINAAKASVVAAMSAHSVARGTLRKLADFNRKTLEERAKTLTA